MHPVMLYAWLDMISFIHAISTLAEYDAPMLPLSARLLSPSSCTGMPSEHHTLYIDPLQGSSPHYSRRFTVGIFTWLRWCDSPSAHLMHALIICMQTCFGDDKDVRVIYMASCLTRAPPASTNALDCPAVTFCCSSVVAAM